MKFDRFDYLVWGILAALALTTGGLLWADDTAGIRILRTLPLADEQAGANTSLQIEFDEPMQAATLFPRFTLTSADTTPVIGQFTWQGTTMIFTPDQPLTPGTTYTAQLEAGGLAETGRVMSQTLRWQFQVRAPRVIYIHPDRTQRDLWTISLTDPTPVQLTTTGGKLYDYKVSPNGDQVAYSVSTDEGGIDLWLINADGTAPHQLVDCSPNRCSTPAWSPDGTLIGYSFERVGVEPGSPYSAPRVWTVNLQSGEAAALFSDDQTVGYGPIWSPDSGRMAFFDQGTGNMRVLNLQTTEEMALSTSTGLPGSWSPDGAAMMFIGMLPDSGVEALFLADFTLKDVSVLMNSETMHGNFLAQPKWSPDGEWVVFNFKPDGTEVGNQLWIMPLDMSFGQIVAADTSYAYYNFEWDARSEGLLYQRLKLGDSEAQPEIMAWTLETWTSTLIVNGTNPSWLP